MEKLWMWFRNITLSVAAQFSATRQKRVSDDLKKKIWATTNLLNTDQMCRVCATSFDVDRVCSCCMGKFGAFHLCEELCSGCWEALSGWRLNNNSYSRVESESLSGASHLAAAPSLTRNSFWRVSPQIWEGLSRGLVPCISMLRATADALHEIIALRFACWELCYPHRWRSPRRSRQLKGQMLMGTCRWCRLGTYQGISTRQIHPPSSATCPGCCTSSAAVTRWNTWSTTHSWPRESQAHFDHMCIFKNAIVKWTKTQKDPKIEKPQSSILRHKTCSISCCTVENFQLFYFERC